MRTNLFQTIDVKTIPSKGISFELTATQEECSSLAERFDLPSVRSFVLSGSVKGNDILRYDGRFEAQVVRECVVSLDEFEQTVSGEFSELFSEKGTDFSAETNFDIDMDDEETVDLIKNGRLEIGEIAAQQFGLHLDPFPKKQEGVFEYKEAEAEQVNPFSVLKNLIKK
ncbi:MAG: DUF177 domain-containing protein [Alphaproteobacteria bacterium]|nr:DUF177 domain-containing protein [Alphaproteobacteria bacterium]